MGKLKRQPLSVTHPNLVKEWDYEKNKPLTPNDVTSGSGEKVWWKCSECGNEWQTRINHRTNGHGCSQCHFKKLSKTKRKTHSEFIKKLSEINPNVVVLDEYQSSKTKVHCKCKICNNVWLAAPTKLLIGRSCPKCGRKRTADARRNNRDDVVSRLRTINPNVKLLGKYESSNKPIECVCLKCGYEWTPTTSNLLAGKGCPKCSHTYHRSHDEFIEEMKQINGNIKITGRFINANTKIKCECLICGYTWTPTPSSLLQGNGCRNCARIKSCNEKTLHRLALKHEKALYRFTVNNETFREKVYEDGQNSSITLLEDYTNSNTKVKVACKTCGYIWESLPHNLYQGHGCPQCNRRKKTNEYFVEELRSINPNVITLDQYTGAHNHVECECTICGNRWKATAHSLLQGSGCPKCGRKKMSNSLRKKHEDFIQEAKLANPDVIIMGEYKSYNTPILCKCLNCNHSWKIRPSDLMRNRGCPNCTGFAGTSYIEQLLCVVLENILGKNKVFNRNRSIGRELDIYVPDLHFAIEYGSWFWHRDKIKKDKEKREICNERGIKLITIYDSCDLDSPPFEDNCFIFSIDLSNKKNSDYLKIFILELLDLLELSDDSFEEHFDEYAIEAKARSKRRGTLKFKKEIAKINPSIEVLGEYHRIHDKIECRCKTCGYRWAGYPSNLLRGAGCPKCNGGWRKTHEEFLEQVNSINSNIEILSEYEGDSNPVICKCLVCNHEWTPTATSLIQGHGCPKCASIRNAEKLKPSQKEFQEKLSIINPNIEVIGSYTNARTGVLCKCTVCNNEWKAIPDTLLNRGSGCPKCSKKRAASKRKIKVNKYDLSGNFICQYESVSDAAKNENIKSPSNISFACKNKTTCNNFLWRYATDDLGDISTPKHHNGKRVKQFDLSGNYIQTFDSITDAALSTGAHHIGDCCNGKRNEAGGFKWKYAE